MSPVGSPRPFCTYCRGHSAVKRWHSFQVCSHGGTGLTERKRRNCRKVNQITKAFHSFTCVDLRNPNLLLATSPFTTYFRKPSLSFKHSCWNGSSSVEYFCGETLRLVNSKVLHVYSANDLQTTLIVIVGSLMAAAFASKLLRSTFRNPVALISVVFSINIKHNHILTQQPVAWTEVSR